MTDTRVPDAESVILFIFKMKQRFFTSGILFFLLIPMLFPQNEASNWLFGENCNLHIDHEELIVLDYGKINALSGCASISDKTGNLLFYTDGKSVMNNSHQVINNGTGLFGNESINQNSIFIPHPGNDDQFYLITVSTHIDSVLRYSLIDKSLDNGTVIAKNISMGKRVMERLTATFHCNNKDVWLITHASDTTFFYSFLIDSNGINLTPVRSVDVYKNLTNIGYMKISPEGTRLVMPVFQNDILASVYFFDKISGHVYQQSDITGQAFTYAFGTGFSSNGHYLYLTTGGQYYELLQYDLYADNSNDLNLSRIKLAKGNLYAMQLACDGRIYIAKANEPFLHVINFPCEKGTDCYFEEDKIYLGNAQCKMGLPNFIQSYFYKPDLQYSGTCYFDTTYFSFEPLMYVDSVKWNFGESSSGSANFSNDFNAEHQYKHAGTYNTVLSLFHCSYQDEITKSITINENPSVNLGYDTTLCDGCTITLCAGSAYDSVFWNNGEHDECIQVNNTGTYWAKVYRDGCHSGDTIIVNDAPVGIFSPTAFTPNGDGLNDLFKVFSNVPLAHYELLIYNKHGSLVFRSSSIDEGWDGYCSTSFCPSENYIWILNYRVTGDMDSAKRTTSGVVFLLR